MIQTVSAIENWFLNIRLKVQFRQCFLTIRLFTISDSFQKLNKTSLNYVNIIDQLNILCKDFYGEQVLNDEPNYNETIIAEKHFHNMQELITLD